MAVGICAEGVVVIPVRRKLRSLHQHYTGDPLEVYVWARLCNFQIVELKSWVEV